MDRFLIFVRNARNFGISSVNLCATGSDIVGCSIPLEFRTMFCIVAILPTTETYYLIDTLLFSAGSVYVYGCFRSPLVLLRCVYFEKLLFLVYF